MLSMTSRKLNPSKSNSPSSSSWGFVPLVLCFDLGVSGPPVPNIASRTRNGSAVSGAEEDCLRPEPFGLLEASSEVVESLEAREREEDRGLNTARCGPEDGARWFGR